MNNQSAWFDPGQVKNVNIDTRGGANTMCASPKWRRA